MDTNDRLLTPGEVADMFRVDPKTVTRWASEGRIGSIRTPGGQRRFREVEIKRLLTEGDGAAPPKPEPAPPAHVVPVPAGSPHQQGRGFERW